MENKKFSLKDELFNQDKVEFIANNISQVYGGFDKNAFIKETIQKFPELELKQRIFHIRDMLDKYLDTNYFDCVDILLNSLPKELDPNLTDNDFGYFILSPYWEYIAKFGCERKYLDFSFDAMLKCTKRFSMEFAIRPFLKKFPEETLKYVELCSKHENYHVRRLASEWIRPNLPWWGKVDLWVENTLKILDNLYTDETQYVLRSVANNLNDLSKIDSVAVIERLKKWQKSKKQSDKNINFLIRHALRTQIKLWNQSALALLGYKKPEIEFINFEVITKKVKLWESAIFNFEIFSKKAQNIIINYHLYFVWANGKLSYKVFHVWKKNVNNWEKVEYEKKHPLREMTTKKLYSWEHFIEVVINGEIFEKKSFKFEAL